MKTKQQGFIFALISSCTFGTIPFFSLPILEAGMNVGSMLTYRFIISTVCLLLMAVVCGQNVRINLKEFGQISILALLYDASAVTMIHGYEFMPSGIATTIQFSYPIFTPIIMFLVFKEKIGWRTILAIALAVLGVMALSSSEGTSGTIAAVGIVLELLAGLTYAIYLVLIPHMSIRTMDSSKLTFYVFLMSTVYMALYAMCIGGLQPAPSASVWIWLFLLGLIPTAVSNITLTLSLKRIGSTLSAILGALEPLTAMVLGIVVMGEPFTALIGVGFVAIIAAVMLLVVK